MYSKEQYMRNLENREIDIIDFLKYILRKWKKIIGITLSIFALMAIVLVGKYQKERSVETVDSAIETETLSEEEKERVESLLQLQQELKELEEYNLNSAYMQMDIYNSSVSTLQYLISTSNEKEQKKAYELYVYYVNEGLLKQQLQESLGNKIDNPAEFIEVVNCFLDENGKYNYNNVLSLRIIAPDDETRKEIVTVVKDSMREYQRKVSVDLIGEHELKFVSESSFSELDWNTKNKQETIQKEISDKKQQITTMKSQMTEQEKAYLNGEKIPKSVNENVVPVFSYKALVFAFIGSVFMAIVILGGVYLASIHCKLKNGNEIVELFGIPCVMSKKEKLREVDKEILKKEFELFCQAQQVKSVFVSYVETKRDESMLKDIMTEVPGIEVVVGDSICNSIESIEKAKKCGNLFFVAKPYETSYNMIVELLQICECFGIEVKGSIIEN